MNVIVPAVEFASRALQIAHRNGAANRAARRRRARWYVKMWRAAGEEIGAVIDVHNDGLLAIRRDGRVTWTRESATALDGPPALRAAGDKLLTKELLRSVGVPTTAHAAFRLGDLEPARAFLATHGPCVVKPATGTSAGAGITTGVRTNGDLRRAAFRAAGCSSDLLIEPQIHGDELRVLVIDGQVVEAVARRPPTVTGDGSHSIGELVDRINSRRRDDGLERAQISLTKDLEMRKTLAASGMTLRTVPRRGEEIQVKSVVHENELDDYTVVTDQLDPSTLAICVAAAHAVGVRLAGVDLITPDIAADLTQAGGVVLEVNTTPGLFHHQGLRRNRVASLILDVALRQNENIGP